MNKAPEMDGNQSSSLPKTDLRLIYHLCKLVEKLSGKRFKHISVSLSCYLPKLYKINIVVYTYYYKVKRYA